MDQPNFRNSYLMQAAIWCLRLVILLQCLGVSGRYFFSGLESESDVYGLLFFDLDWPEVVAQRIDDWGMLACFAAGWTILLGALLQKLGSRPNEEISAESKRPGVSTAQSTLSTLGRRLEWFAAVVVGVWTLTLAATHMVRGELYAEFALGEQAVRYLAPFMLIFISASRLSNHDSSNHDSSNHRSSNRGVLIVLTSAVAATFAVHGYMALNGHGSFTDLVLLSDARITKLEFDQTQVESALFVIGLVDIILAILLVATQWRWIAVYMTVWGLLTAASRITAFGLIAWPEALIRSSNWGVPLTVALILIAKRNRLPAEANHHQADS